MNQQQEHAIELLEYLRGTVQALRDDPRAKVNMAYYYGAGLFTPPPGLWYECQIAACFAGWAFAAPGVPKLDKSDANKWSFRVAQVISISIPASRTAIWNCLFHPTNQRRTKAATLNHLDRQIDMVEQWVRTG